jgi:uncharacterized protein YcnI
MRLALSAAAAALALSIAVPPPAAAHITLETAEAAPNAWYRAVFRVPHGCGDAATTRITIRLPEGITAARPMPKPGWSLTLTPRPGVPAPTGHGAVPEVGVISWEGGPLPNAHYDEFVIRFRTPNAPGQTVWIPVRQDCEGGRYTDWAETPAPGQRAASPAPRLQIIAR